jgi:hypothetical protein
MVAAAVSLFFLEQLEKKSKKTAWQSSALWLPLIAMTGFAATIHIPTYAVALLCLAYGIWAYRRARVTPQSRLGTRTVKRYNQPK